MTDLRRAAEEYLAVRRTLGFELVEVGRLLPDFVSFLEDHHAERVTVELALVWAEQPPGKNPGLGGRRLEVVRGFARHLQASDPATEVPPVGLLPRDRRRVTPFLYSSGDIAALMGAARELRPPLRAATYETLIGLLAVSGLRVGEALRLERSDVDWTEGLLVIRDSKFHKSRQVPLQSTTLMALAAYDERRDQLCRVPTTTSFFVSTTGNRLAYASFHQVFARLLSAAGIASSSTRRRPRPHDLRHSFAVRTLLCWYRDGVDVPASLPLLSTYLGHLDPAATYWYLTAAPELLALAAQRLEQSGAPPS